MKTTKTKEAASKTANIITINTKDAGRACSFEVTRANAALLDRAKKLGMDENVVINECLRLAKPTTTKSQPATIRRRVWLNPEQIERVRSKASELSITESAYLLGLIQRDQKSPQVLEAALNSEAITSAAQYFCANSRRLPIWRLKLPVATCNELQPLVKLVAEKWGLTPIQSSSVVAELALRRILFGE
jgi:hypothetical protein